MTTRIKQLCLAAAVMTAVLAPATAAHAAVSQQDVQFLRDAHQANLFEIAGGELARQNGASQTVRELGDRFVTDHTRLDQALQRTAAELSVSLPDAPNAAQQALLARYRATSGSAFDALYIATQMDAHAMTLQLGEKELAQGSDPRVRQLATDAAPVIRAHHQALQAAAGSLGLPTGVDAGSGGNAADQPVRLAPLALGSVGLMLIVGAAARLRRAPAAQR